MGSDAKVVEVDLEVGNDGGSSEVVENDAGLSEVVGNEGGPSEAVDPHDSWRRYASSHGPFMMDTSE